MTGDELARFDVDAMVAQIETINDVKAAEDICEQARMIAQQSKLGSGAINHANIAKARVMRRGAEIVDAGQAAGQIAKPGKPPGSGGLPTLEDLGLVQQRVGDWRVIRDGFTDDDLRALDDKWAQPQEPLLTLDRLLSSARQARAKHYRAALIEQHAEWRTVHGDGIDTRVGDFREVLDDISCGSVDAIITDPPYPIEYAELWSDLGAFAARVLKPSGCLVAMTPHANLLDYANRLIEHLDFRWIAAYLVTGPHATHFTPRIRRIGWKPILIMSVAGSDRDNWGWISFDVYRSEGIDKRFDHWGQSESGIARMVEQCTLPGALVVDPFLGGGTTAVVCRDLGRRFIGCDIEPGDVAITRERLDGAA
jgi:hypothetical protein